MPGPDANGSGTCFVESVKVIDAREQPGFDRSSRCSAGYDLATLLTNATGRSALRP
jgi:hypothetical protein